MKIFAYLLQSPACRLDPSSLMIKNNFFSKFISVQGSIFLATTITLICDISYALTLKKKKKKKISCQYKCLSANQKTPMECSAVTLQLRCMRLNPSRFSSKNYPSQSNAAIFLSPAARSRLHFFLPKVSDNNLRLWSLYTMPFITLSSFSFYYFIFLSSSSFIFLFFHLLHH